MPPLLRLARSRDIAAEVAARLESNEEVIAASSGMASAIAAELLARHPHGVAGIRLQTLNDLARRILNDAGEYPRVAGDAERRLAMRTAARAIDDPMMESRGMAAMLERSYRDVRDAGVTLADFDARARRAALRNGQRTQLVIRAWREYERLIAQCGAIDPADLLGRAAALVKRAAVAPQIVAGFYDMTGAQLALIEALRDAGKLAAVFIPAGESEAYAFARPLIAKFSGGQPLLPVLSNEPRVSVSAHETKLDELRFVCAEVRRLLDEGVPPRAIGIVSRALDDDDARLLARFANELGFSTTATTATPLLAHRLGRGLATILRLRDRGFPRGDVFELLRDGFSSKRRIAVDAIDVATRKARVAGGTSSELQNVAWKLEDYVAVVAELEQLAPPAVLRGSEWSDTLASLAARFRLETDLDLEAAEAIDDVCALFRRWPSTRFDASLVIDAIEQHEIGGATAAGIIATDVMAFRGRSVEHLFAIRMQDDLFPQRRVDDPLVPDVDRRELRLRQIGDGRDEERLLFELLFDAAGASVRFSYASGDGFGKILRCSSFLRPWRTGTLACPPARRQARVPVLHRPLQLLAKSGTQSNFDGYLTRPPVLPASISPTQLEDFGECPQKFLVKHLLGAQDLDDPDRELQLHHREKGKLDHRILERFYRALTPDELARAEQFLPRVEPALAERLHELVDDEFDKLDVEAPPFNRTMRDMERRATKRILRDFVARDLGDLAASGLAPIEFEYRFSDFTIHAHDVPIRVEGTIDRIDASGALHPAGACPERSRRGHPLPASGERDHEVRYRIVDYKSGKALRHKDLDAKIDRGVRLQLALYAMAVAERFAADPSRISGTIKPLVPGGAKPEKYAFELAAKAPRLRETLDLFVGAIVGGSFPAFPNDNDDQFNSCKYCPVNLACRTKHDAEEKFALQQTRDPRTLLEGRRQKAESRSDLCLPPSAFES